MSDAEILEAAIERLRYGARRGQWATELTAEQCRVVVEALTGMGLVVASLKRQMTEGVEDL